MGNFSRDTFDRLKHYVGVRLQQGVPLVDADVNELEDIRKYELRTFIKWFVGDGVPAGNNGFAIQATGTANDLLIVGGDGTPEGAGRCLVEGWEAINESDMLYTAQPLFNNAALAAEWGVPPAPVLTTPGASRTDAVFLDVWEREINSLEDTDLVNPAIGVETAVRLKREWAVRVAEGQANPPVAPAAHSFYPLARISRTAGTAVIAAGSITDLRETGLTLSDLLSEIAGARGNQGSLNDRLDQSLDDSGGLRPNVVSNANVSPSAAIQESKILFSATGHSHAGGGNGNTIGTSGIEDEAITLPKINFEIVNNGSEVDIAPGQTRAALIEADIPLAEGKNRIYLPAISITGVEGAGTAQVTAQLEYRSTQTADNFDVFLRITNLTGGTETVDLVWYVYTFGDPQPPIVIGPIDPGPIFDPGDIVIGGGIGS